MKLNNKYDKKNKKKYSGDVVFRCFSSLPSRSETVKSIIGPV